MPSFADRVSETTTTTGTGPITTAGAVAGFQTFFAGYGLVAYFPYCIELNSASQWEVGVGYLSASSTLVRDRVQSSSNAGFLVNFSAGAKNVFSPEPAASAGGLYRMRFGAPAMTRF